MARNIGNPNSPSPVFGLPPGYSIADLDTRLGQSSTSFLAAVTTNTTSAAKPMGAHSISIGVSCTDPAQTCTINVYTSSGSDTLVYTVTGVKHGQTIYVGNNEGVDLGGLPLKIATAAMSGSAATSVSARLTS